MVVLGLMVGTSLATMVGMPTAKLADTRPAIDLERAVPRQFGDWRIDPSIMPLPPSPDQEANLRRTYDQILSRAYVNGRGTRVMLSLTYGSKQTQQLRAHRQEVCYAAQGFKITRLEHTMHRVGGVDIPVTRMVATQGTRVEPVTYWFTTGDTVVLTYLQREMAQFKYALSGFIPDGYLVRVSSLSSDPADAYAEQLEFANALLEQVDASLRRRLLGHS
ncbi:MAG TPA: EpsI family protein [Lysobacter sp.]|jgi:EpsI family protein|nr:EpsI family protein [Lysobacter sp.]